MPNPIRLYVLHHPNSSLGAQLTDKIYDWFRLPSLEGIPVYVRSVAAGADGAPLLPEGEGTDPNVLEYLIPLVDAEMVRDPAWHDYLCSIAKGLPKGKSARARTHGWAIFPVALDSSAFNLPQVITRQNFIRHGMGKKIRGIAPDKQSVLDTEETIKHLTEALARDLNGRLFPRQAANRFKIFISYSRADSTAIAKALRDYIQGETQCVAFLDENDIAYGQAFDESLNANVNDHSRAMIVVNGDNYADRPWCRWEIGKFTSPRLIDLDAVPSNSADRKIHIYHPLLVVDALNGPDMTRVVPELAQAPMVRWEEGRAKLCFSVLMREVLMGLKDVLVARQVLATEDLTSALVVNRLPGPVALARLFRAQPGSKSAPASPVKTIHHPGIGLPLIELRLLQHTFSGIQFLAFRDLMRESARSFDRQVQTAAASMRLHLEGLQTGQHPGLPLRGKVIAISTAHSQVELAALGYLSQHQDEALIHLLRPLVRMGADILYGGPPPITSSEPSGNSSLATQRNISVTLLQLMSDERREDEGTLRKPSALPPRGSLLFNVASWPECLDIAPRDEAAWISTCRILPVLPQDAGLSPWIQPQPKDRNQPLPDFRRYLALTLSQMRSRVNGKMKCRLPGDGEFVIQPAAYIFMGGKLTGFAGIMPGIMEEFLFAAASGRPIYLFGRLGGASGVIARALCAEAGATRPPEFEIAHYLAQPKTETFDYQILLAELKAADNPSPQERFDELWTFIDTRKADGLDKVFHNGLSHEDNKTLITTANTFEAVRLVWKGFSQLSGMLSDGSRGSRKTKPSAGRKARKGSPQLES